MLLELAKKKKAISPRFVTFYKITDLYIADRFIPVASVNAGYFVRLYGANKLYDAAGSRAGIC